MSDILKAVHQTAKGLRKTGVIDKTTMRKFDSVCLTKVLEFTADEEFNRLADQIMLERKDIFIALSKV